MTRQSASSRGLAAPAPLVLLVLLALGAGAGAAAAQSLYGSHESLVKQNLVAQQHDYAYLRNTQELTQAVENGTLVPVRGNDDYQLAGEEVSFPYARAEVKTFLEQLACAYRAACGEPLVVTSLVRPISRQPWNASPISVHPTGMAVDLRRSDRRGCRQWLESTLLALEGEGMIEATRERWPPHYHVAVFPDPLLLPGPIGDPNGVVRLAALAVQHGGALSEPDARFADSESHPGSGRVHLGRSARTGRLRISQGAVARHGQRSRQAQGAAPADGRIDIHRSRSARDTRPGAGSREGSKTRGRQRQTGGVANRSGLAGGAAGASASRHHAAAHTRPHPHSRTAARATTVAAR